MRLFLIGLPGKLDACPKSEQSRLQTPERKTSDMKDKQVSCYLLLGESCSLFIMGESHLPRFSQG